MIAICVDDERRIMEHTVRMCLNRLHCRLY